MTLAAGAYRGRIGDRVFFTGLSGLGASPYAGAGPYSASGVGRARLGATGLSQLRSHGSEVQPTGMQFAGFTLGQPPIPHQRVTLPSGRTIVFY